MPECHFCSGEAKFKIVRPTQKGWIVTYLCIVCNDVYTFSKLVDDAPEELDASDFIARS
jgi:hypothetical protein